VKAAVRLEWGVAAETLCHCAKYPLRRFPLTHKKNAAFAATGEYKVNKDQVSGKVEQAVGKVKQSVGETLGNEKLANQGVVDQAKGAAKETRGNAKGGTRSVSRCKMPRIKPARRSTSSRSAIQPDGVVASIKSSEDSRRSAECWW
jgi:uncharacterized protein YjbJ (UPF0337 family)